MPPDARIAVPNMSKPAVVAALRDAMAYLNARMPAPPNLLALRDELVGDMARALFLLNMQ